MHDTMEFDEGVPLVHVDYGVGRHEGLTRIELDGETREFVTLRYADDDRLHVPLHALHLLSRYNCIDCDAAPLHALGKADAWRERRDAAARDALATAARLLAARARRAALEGFGFDIDRERFARFADAFPHALTDDQRRATDEILDDLASAQPMDRVVCGDVGFGKTEVAMRAAFVAVDAGTQVAVIVPTTVLARQHHAKFTARFADWPVEIASLCGADAADERERALERLAAGEVDIVVGTQALLGEDVAFDALGLVVVDEEQRFGAADKERVRELRDAVNVLTLTATPIPRTLRMGLDGVRDLSLVATPPVARRPVRTDWVRDDGERALAACRDELERDGQIYWLHNDVESIERAAAALADALPDARVGIAHGQMEEGELDAAMQGFVDAEIDVLVATTIIESGIDVANANTIVVEDAERLGLAQLHQLRGRVGRGERQARAVLLSSPEDALAADARKRLEAIVAHSGLGAGLDVARHDLDIRGAGELLGEEQSGQATEVGLALYSALLEQSVAALREDGSESDPGVAALEAIAPTTVDLGRPASIPERDIADAEERLRWYLAIDAAADETALETLRTALEERLDRTLPEESARLFDTVGLRLLCRQAGLRAVELGPGGGVVRPREGRELPGPALERQVREAFGASCRVDDDGALHVDGDFETHDRVVALVEVLVEAMGDGEGTLDDERERVAAVP